MGARRSKVLDAGAFLNSSFFDYGNAITVPQVLDEVKSKSTVVEALLDAGMVKIVEPSADSVKTVEAAAKKLGEINKLSRTDVLVLALAYETGSELITDDFHVQNVAEDLGIRYTPVTESIRKKIKWVRRCARCGRKIPENYKGSRCPYCGGKIIYSSK